MKKLLAVLGILTLAGSTAATLVACGGGLDTSPVTGEKIWLITDAGKKDDKSFNESGFMGGNYFENNIRVGGSKNQIQFTEPPTLTELEATYTNAKLDGARTLILPGFHHAVEGENKAPQIMNGGSTIILDNTDGGFDNQIGIMYRGDISGFLAAFGGMVQLSNEIAFKDKPLKMATFGGSHNAGAVDNFMVGYLAAIEVYREVVKDKTLAVSLGINVENNVSFDRIKTQKTAPANDFDEAWFTNSFSMGEGAKITESMLKEGANIIMPVAGPQTQDVLVAMNNKDEGKPTDLFVIGVDTDQAEAYKELAPEGRFISSAQKALMESTVIALGHSKGFVEDTTVQNKIVDYGKDSSFTIEKDKKFEPYKLEEHKADAWEGKTLWMGGKAATNGRNKLESSTSETINEKITGEILEKSSIDLFTEIDREGSATNILSDKTITKYAKTIIDAIKTEQSETPNLDALKLKITDAKLIDQGTKTEEAFNVLKEAILTAEAVKEEALAEEALTVLNKAINDFEKSEDKPTK